MTDELTVDLIVNAVAQGFDKISEGMDKGAASIEKLATANKKSSLSFTDLKSAIGLGRMASPDRSGKGAAFSAIWQLASSH